MEQAPHPFEPARFGDYTLLWPLATGGMGELFLARRGGSEPLCVVKKLRAALTEDSQLVGRFTDEAKLLSRLDHPGIARILDAGTAGGDPFIAMEYVPGKDLRAILARCRERSTPLPLPLALHLMAQVLDALAYAHRKKDPSGQSLRLVHRDVSPQNILVSYEGEVKIIDFGLAKSALSAGRTQTSMIIGKFFYMSPEQATHAKVDLRSDLYSAGICLWEAIAGRNPFEGTPSSELLDKVASPRIPPPSSIRPEIPPVVDSVLMGALEPSPGERFGSAEQMRDELLKTLRELHPGAGSLGLASFMGDSFSLEHEAEQKLLSRLAELPDPPAPAHPHRDGQTMISPAASISPLGSATGNETTFMRQTAARQWRRDLVGSPFMRRTLAVILAGAALVGGGSLVAVLLHRDHAPRRAAAPQAPVAPSRPAKPEPPPPKVERATPEAHVERPPMKKLKGRKAELDREYQRLLSKEGCTKLGALCRTIKPQVDRDFARALSDPRRVTEAETLLDRYERGIDGRRKPAGRSSR